MATLHPALTRRPSTNQLGAQAEYDVLTTLEMGLPDGFDVFHNVDWSSIHNDEQNFGEIDVAVLNPEGHVVLLEVKSGAVEISGNQLLKHYGTANGTRVRNVGFQAKRQHSAIRARLQNAGLGRIQLNHFLVLTNQIVQSDIVAYPRERIIDSADMATLCTRIQRSFHANVSTGASREAVFAFLANEYRLLVDVDAQDQTAQRATRELSDGLALWVPRIEAESGIFLVEATAGSGKTQLALQLLQTAAHAQKRAAYVCFNRPLADHMVRMLPPSVQVLTFHEYCLEFFRQSGNEPDFQAKGVFETMAQFLVSHGQVQSSDVDLLVVDEYQDLQAEWVQALLERVSSSGRAYVLGDPDQKINRYEPFELSGCVRITSMDNYRSPRAVVRAMNELRLTDKPVIARASVQGEMPGFETYDTDCRPAIDIVVRRLLRDGYGPHQIALVSFAGKEHSQLLSMPAVAGFALRKPTGQYDQVGNALWTQGELLADTVGRFKGQSAAVVVLTDIDFETLDERVLHKLFVGFTRARLRLECVGSKRGIAALAKHL